MEELLAGMCHLLHSSLSAPAKPPVPSSPATPVQRGCLLGPAKPLLVLKDPQAVAELRQLEVSTAGGPLGAGINNIQCRSWKCSL